MKLEALTTMPARGIVAQPGPALSVRATDLSGIPVAGVPVTFTFAATNARAQVPTNADGIAALTQWTLPSKSGQYRATASAPLLTAVVFDVTVNAGPLATLSLLSDSIVSGNAAEDGPPIRVAGIDALANPVVGATVTFSVNGAAKLGDAQTDSTGIAQLASWKLPLFPATYVIGATSDNNVTAPLVRLTVKLGPPSRLLPFWIPASGPVATNIPIIARVTDLAGNSVPGASVDWSVVAGRAAVSPSAILADSLGVVRATLALGTVAGPVLVRGLISGTTIGADVTVAAVPGPFFALTPGYTDLSLPANTPFTGSVRATDAWGNPIPGVALKPRSGGIEYTLLPTPAMTPASTVTDANGKATFSSVTAPQPGLQNWLIDGPGFSAWFRVRASGSTGYITPWNGTPTAGLTRKVGSGRSSSVLS